MKRLSMLVLLAVTAPAVFAHDHDHGHPGYYYHGHDHGYWRYDGGRWTWMIPAIIGGVVVYQATHDPEPVVVQSPPPVVVQQPVVVEQQTTTKQVQKQNCSPWTEVQNADGTITRTRTCTQ